jgi:mRNA-degrading endonuclease RelE of RelBE toxin-antitoxin system
MRILRADRFVEDFRDLPPRVQKQTLRKLELLAGSLAHPSLRVKRVRSRTGIYEGSINMDYRFLFRVEGDACILLRIGRHDILDSA